MRAIAAIACLAFAVNVLASTPYVRSFDTIAGFNSAEIRAITQDPRGYLWFASDSGLMRFDGQQVQRFAPTGLVCTVMSVTVDAFGVSAHDSCGQWFAVDLAGRTTLLLPPTAGVVRAAASVGSRRFAVRDRDLIELVDGKPIAVGVAVNPEPFNFPRLLALPCGVLLSTAQTSWLLRSTDPGATPQRLHSADGGDIGDVVAAAGCDARPLALLSRFPGSLYRADDSAATALRRVHSERNRGIGLAYRGQHLWASYDVKLLAFAADDVAINYRQSRELPSGGPLMVDAENALWLGSISRLLQLPEPDAQRFDTDDGLVSAHAYAVIAEPWRGNDAVMAISWQGAHRLRKGQLDHAKALDIFGSVCSGATHSWYALRSHWRLDRAAGTLRQPRDAGDDSSVVQCAQLGGIDYAVSERGLLRRQSDSAAPLLLRAALEPSDAPGMSALASHRGRLWLAARNTVCNVAPDAPDGVAHCSHCAPGSRVRQLLSVGDQLYAAAPPLGIVRIDDQGCHLQQLDDDTLGPLPIGLSPAQAGGFWAYSNLAVLRVQPSGTDALQVVQRVGRAEGLTQPAATTVLDTGSELWVGNTEGFTRLASPANPPPAGALQLTALHLRADGLPQTNGQTLPAGTRVVELGFAGLSFRAPEALRYRHRINRGPWSAPSRHNSLTLTGVQPGDYEVAVAFQADRHAAWSAPESLRFSVRAPWHRTGWGQALIAASALAAIGALLRLRRARRRALQRQRAEIAADLHDELGSELASVRVLSTLLERPDLSAEDRRALIADLQESSDAASGNLRHLVEQMKADPTVSQLLAQLNRLAERLCGATLQSRFKLAGHDSDHALRASQIRQLTLFWREVLSNVARHAGADQVSLRAALHDKQLVMECRDNGCGFDPSSTHGYGLGHLRERAGRLGASLLLDSGPEQGTLVRLVLPL